MPRKRAILQPFAILVSIGLLAWVVCRLKDPRELSAAFLQAWQSPQWLLMGILAFGGALACGTLRWWILLKALSIPMKASRTVQLYAVGHFYNIIIPGATGGDVVKAGCAVLEHPEKRPEAVASILAERVIGFLALAVIVTLVAAFRGDIFTDHLRWVRWFCFAFGTATFVAFGLLFGVDVGFLFTRRHGGTEDGELGGWRGLVLRLYEAMRLCSRHPQALGKVFALSMGNHVCTALCTGFIGMALGAEVRMLDVVCVSAVVNAVTAISLTPGGAGVREFATLELLKHIHVTDSIAVTMSLLTFGVILLWAAIGGVCYMILRWKTNENV